jgi:hypothetical protein
MRPYGKCEQTFNETSVVEYFKESEFKEINPKKLVDFLSPIYTRDLDILASWTEHFESVGTPYAITKEISLYKDGNGTRKIDKFALWKEQRV